MIVFYIFCDMLYSAREREKFELAVRIKEIDDEK